MASIEELQSIKFGERVAEEEILNLSDYFVETDNWRRVFNGEIDVVYGSKGSGKSAIYTILDANKDNLFDKSILLTTAENPRGDTVFEGLSIDPPTTEAEFVRLWKLYFIVITRAESESWGINNKYFDELKKILDDTGLVPPQKGLKSILRVCRDYVRRITSLESIQPGISLSDTNDTLPFGFNLKIAFREPDKREVMAGIKSIEYLYELLEAALKEAKFTLWIAIDRLDVAFTENIPLETNALKALFKVYRDLALLNNLRIKIFLRDDIWRRITENGFREASHITKSLIIIWSREAIVNLIVSRLLNNQYLVDKYDLDKEEILSDYKAQEELFYRLFPGQIEVGHRKPKTIDWIVGHLKDGKGVLTPREIIHLFNEAKQEQIRNMETGQNDLEGENIIGKNAFKVALDVVSKVRLEQTIYAEYPSLKPYIEKLKSEKTEQRIESLAIIWSLSEEETKKYAKKLVEIGFFQEKGDIQSPRFWVPFIYRNELKMIQGTAD